MKRDKEIERFRPKCYSLICKKRQCELFNYFFRVTKNKEMDIESKQDGGQSYEEK